VRRGAGGQKESRKPDDRAERDQKRRSQPNQWKRDCCKYRNNISGFETGNTQRDLPHGALPFSYVKSDGAPCCNPKSKALE